MTNTVMVKNIEDKDTFCHFLFDPGNFESGLLKLGKSFIFESKYGYEESAASLILCSEDSEKVHKIGRDKATADSAKKNKLIGYCGSAWANVGVLRGLSHDLGKVLIEHRPEGFYEHCVIALADAAGKRQPKLPKSLRNDLRDEIITKFEANALLEQAPLPN